MAAVATLCPTVCSAVVVDNPEPVEDLPNEDVASTSKVEETQLEEKQNEKDEGDLYSVEMDEFQVPIVYRPEYNIKAFGIEKLHPFDAGKWGNVLKHLKNKKLLDESKIVKPREASKADLLLVHTPAYLSSLKYSVTVARITEVLVVAMFPNSILQSRVLRPFRYQTGGSVLAGRLAVEKGWAVNIGGGFHHCSGNRGGGFCAYADITLTITFVLKTFPNIKRVMIIDLDAHQGNGHERDFSNRRGIYILDIYNSFIYPRDEVAKKAINRRVEIAPFTENEEYLDRVVTHVEGALNEFRPHFVLYNAGTDVLKGDPLGLLSLTAEGIIKRDEIVWQKVRRRKIPMMMVTSGGYQRRTAAIIADSLANLNAKGFISLNPSD
ncbi:histone deacetylase 11 [Oratosquilla oratoria]|uniref:histone deacetylase 11 n=1 Tax=Oratosquilla oratoria TaxID=337810 RepID=UPI003F75E608